MPLLGQVPLTLALREHSDSGTPVVLADPRDTAAKAIDAIALKLIAKTPVELPVMGLEAPTVAAPKAAGMSLPMA